jgi:hypothetical protein
MYGRLSASVIVCVLTLGFAASADAQLIPSVTPVFDRPTPSTFNSRAASLFAASQIVDRPTSDLRPRFYWGVYGSVVPSWSVPGSMGTWFFESVSSANPPKMNGRDLRVGLVRARQVGFEMGVSLVRKTVTSFTIVRDGEATGNTATRWTYTALDDMKMTGVDAHLVVPIARFGERVQLGILGAGGIAWIPDVPIQKRIDGPPFYADSTTTSVALNSPPATGGFVRNYFDSVPLVPGTTYGLTTTGSLEIAPTDYVWLLLRGQLAADFLVARPLKIRVAAGFNYPGMQAIGIDAVYLFRTGARSSPAKIAGTTDPTAAPGAGQIADRPQVLAPRRSYWGVLGGVTPKWWTPSNWTEFFEDIVFDSPVTMEGRDIRIGVTRGRPLGKEFGFSFVQKSLTRFALMREGRALLPNPSVATNQTAPAASILLTELETVKMPGADFHAFIPVDRIGSRLQLGALLGIGAAHVPNTPIRKRIEGPPFIASPTSSAPLTTVPASGGFVLDENGQAFPVPPGQTGADAPAFAPEISPLNTFYFLARAQFAADVLLAAPFKLRFTAGFNYPGAQLFGIEGIYLFGTGQR